MPDHGLTAEDLNLLAHISAMVSAATPQHQPTAITVAVHHISTYRDRATWDQLATALTITPTELRRWRDHATTKTHHSPVTRPLHPDTSPSSPTAVSPTAVLIITGHPRAQPHHTNDFTTEIAAIRDRCDTRFTTTEIAGIALHRLTTALDDHHPHILHIAAHSSHDDIFLTNTTHPVAIPSHALANAITHATWKPHLIVLNFCDSIRLAHRLTNHGPSTTSWPTTINDVQAREFAQTLYHELARGQPLGTALDNTTITLTRWPDLPRPHLTGNRNTTFR